MGDADLELARQVLLSVDRLLRGQVLVALVGRQEDLQVGAGARRQLLGQRPGQLSPARIVLGIQRVDGRTHHVAVHVAAGRQGPAFQVGLVQMTDQRAQVLAEDPVILDRLARGDAQRAVGEGVGRVVQRRPLLRAQQPSAGVLDADHEDQLAGLAAALAADLLLVDAEELGQLLGAVAQGLGFAGLHGAQLVPEGMGALGIQDVEEPVAAGLDALVLGHLLEGGGVERHGGLGGGLPGHRFSSVGARRGDSSWFSRACRC
jgi:hypothetical protein